MLGQLVARSDPAGPSFPFRIETDLIRLWGVYARETNFRLADFDSVAVDDAGNARDFCRGGGRTPRTTGDEHGTKRPRNPDRPDIHRVARFSAHGAHDGCGAGRRQAATTVVDRIALVAFAGASVGPVVQPAKSDSDIKVVFAAGVSLLSAAYGLAIRGP
jgi:hypothetical protein